MVSSVRPAPHAPVVNHRRPAPARTWTPSRSELSRALAMGPGHLDRFAAAGFIRLGRTTLHGLAWMLQAPWVDCGRVLPLIQNNRPTPPEHCVWAECLSGPWPKRGFPYDQATTARLIAEGTATFITGVLSIAAITPEPDGYRLLLNPVARLMAAEGTSDPQTYFNPHASDGERDWARLILGRRYTPRRGGAVILI